MSAEAGESAVLSLDRQHPADAAEYLADLPLDEARAHLASLPERQQAMIFGYFEPGDQVALAEAMPRAELAALVSAMSSDERADLVRQLDEVDRAALLRALAQADRDDIRRLISYEEGTAGSVMSSDYASLSPDLQVREAIEALRRIAPDRETIYDAYVTDADRRLLGVVSLRDLILAVPTARVGDLMVRDVITARAEDPREEAARTLADYDLLALPILDADGRLLGILTADDAMDVAEEEATRDILKGSAVSEGPEDQGLIAGLKSASIFLVYRMRIFWLVGLVFGNIFSGLGIARYEELIEANITLVFFLPLLIASGGNAGAQSATLVVRGMATGDVEMGDWLLLTAREVAIAGLLGLSMAIAVAAIGFARGGPDIALVVALAMMAIVLVGSLIGLSLPFLLGRFKLDPATASGPLVTSIADVAGVLIYLGIASRLLTLEG
jgi:magnesium transporter